MSDPVTDGLSGAATGAAVGSVVPGWGTAIGAGVGLGAGIISYFIQSGQMAKAQALIKAAQDKYGQVTDAALAAAARDTLGPNALAQITQDPSFQSAQQQSLAALKGISDNGGLNASDRAALNETTNAAALASERSRNGISSALSRNGLFGSGASAEAALESQQAQQNTNAQAAQNTFGQAQQRSLQAIMDRGGLAAQMQGADWQRQSDVARAQNERDQLLWGNRQDLYRQKIGLAGQQYGFAQQNAGLQTQQGQLAANAIGNAGHDIGGALIGGDAAAKGKLFSGLFGGSGSQPSAPTPPATSDGLPPSSVMGPPPPKSTGTTYSDSYDMSPESYGVNPKIW